MPVVKRFGGAAVPPGLFMKRCIPQLPYFSPLCCFVVYSYDSAELIRSPTASDQGKAGGTGAMLRLRVMTYNIGGGRRDYGSSLEKLAAVIRREEPDVLAVQEGMDFQDADGGWHGPVYDLATMCGFGANCSFAPTLSLAQSLDVRQATMVDALFEDCLDWHHGNALYDRIGFCRLSDPTRPGVPRNVPIHRTPVYLGNRDSEPRFAQLARLSRPPLYPYVVNTHLSTLRGERGQGAQPEKTTAARELRTEETQRIVDLLAHHVLDAGHPVIVCGDFNAMADEACMADVLVRRAGFMLLTPDNAETWTHPKVPRPVDHILVAPPAQVVEYRCRVITDSLVLEASDHRPVVADLVLKEI